VRTVADLPGDVPRSYLYSYAGDGAFSVRAFQLHDASSGDEMTFSAPSVVGTYQLDKCAIAVICPGIVGRLGMKFNSGTFTEGDTYFELLTGTLTLTRVDAGRIEGTFSGSGNIQNLVSGEMHPFGRITVKNGRFSTIPKPLPQAPFDRSASGKAHLRRR
jgi:hypothetical protein